EIMRAGRRVIDLPELARIRNDCHEQLMSLPAALRLLAEPDDMELIYPVAISSGLRALADSFDPDEEGARFRSFANRRLPERFAPVRRARRLRMRRWARANLRAGTVTRQNRLLDRLAVLSV